MSRIERWRLQQLGLRTALGRSHTEIADELRISEGAVTDHRKLRAELREIAEDSRA